MDKETLISRIVSHQPRLLPETAKESAVLIVVVEDEYDEFSLVVTKRAETVLSAGEYCFPGGTKNILERNFDVAVMDEVKQELNIGEEHYERVGQLDDFLDHEGNRVRPFVVFMTKKVFDDNVQVSADEIVDVHFMPLSELTYIVDSQAMEQLTRRSPSYVYLKGMVKVWGLTAAIMTHFTNLVLKQNNPVGHELKK